MLSENIPAKILEPNILDRTGTSGRRERGVDDNWIRGARVWFWLTSPRVILSNENNVSSLISRNGKRGSVAMGAPTPPDRHHVEQV